MHTAIEEILLAGHTARQCYEALPPAAGMWERADWIRENDPEGALRLIARAQLCMQGKLVLCGTGGAPYFVGSPPNWSANPVHDNEFVWELNRMAHWVTLLRAWRLTGEARYAARAALELEDWIAACPRPALSAVEADYRARFCAVTPWRTLEVGIRAFGSWSTLMQELAGTPLLTEALFARAAVSLHEHAEVLFSVCPLLWPDAGHNHYLNECLGLLDIACRYPFFREAAHWRAHAIRELERCACAQILPDGGQAEGCPTYHHECVALFARSLQLARAFGLRFSKEYGARVRAMGDYALYTCRPNGESVPWGDSDADLRGARTALELYGAFGDDTLLRQYTRLAGARTVRAALMEKAWELPDPAVVLHALDQPGYGEDAPLPPTVRVFAEHSQVSLRTGWTAESAGVFFACRLPVYNDHAHIDPMGFDFFARGRAVAPDAGRYTYEEGPDRRAFKTGPYHNTLLVDSRDAFEYRGTWAYGPARGSGSILAAGQADGIPYAVARHDAYRPAEHTRLLALVGEDRLLVLDRVTGLVPGQSVDRWFHLDYPEADLSEEGRITACGARARCVLLYTAPFAPALLPGRISKAVDQCAPSVRVRLRAVADADVLLCGALLCAGTPPQGLLAVRVEGDRLTVSLEGVPLWHWDPAANRLQAHRPCATK